MGRLVGKIKDLWVRSMMHRAMLVEQSISLILEGACVSVSVLC